MDNLRKVKIKDLMFIPNRMYQGLKPFGKNDKKLKMYIAQTILSDEEYCNMFNLEKVSKPKKGLLLFGNTGTGKTTFIQRFADKMHYDFYNFSCLVNDFVVTKNPETFYNAYFDKTKDKTITVYDDLGAEGNAKRYGSDTFIMDFMYRRYDLFANYGTLTHFTTNLKCSDDIREFYGDRIFSRLNEMCYFIEVNGNDNRMTYDINDEPSLLK